MSATMADEKPKDRHKNKPLQLRLPPILRQQLEVLARRNLTTLTAEASRAIRELLSREELWPPPSRPRKDHP